MGKRQERAKKTEPESSAWEASGGRVKSAQEAMLSLERLVGYWEEAPGVYSEDECLWGEILREQALDLGLTDIWMKLPKDKKPCPMSQLDEVLAALRRRDVDLGQASLCVQKGGNADICFNVPRAFPTLGIMPMPDPKKVGLLS